MNGSLSGSARTSKTLATVIDRAYFSHISIRATSALLSTISTEKSIAPGADRSDSSSGFMKKFSKSSSASTVSRGIARVVELEEYFSGNNFHLYAYKKLN